MGITIQAVGGYQEIGRNMTAVKIDDDVIVLDMGLHLPNYIQLTEDEDIVKLTKEELYAADACPKDQVIHEWKDKVRVIIPTHAHLDHIGAIPYLAEDYKAPILCTPYTTAVIRTILKEEKIRLRNPIKTINVNSTYEVNEEIKVEFINITHSTPQAVMVAIHTKYGIVLYANDFKFDNTPTLGKKPNYKALERVGEQGVICAIVESLYAGDDRKTPSEAVAKAMLKDVMLGTNSEGNAMIVTTFSSHLARLKSIVEFGKQLGRKIVFLGRSLAKYCLAGVEANIVEFPNEVEIVKFGHQIKRKVKQIEREGKEKYVMVVTGHQGEPKATLSKMATGIIPFKFDPSDQVIFSCNIIPAETNIEYRRELEAKLKDLGVRVFKDIHVSGHAAREDLRDLLMMVKPKIIIPAHAEPKAVGQMEDLAKDLGFDPDSVRLVRNGDRVKI